MEDNQTWSLVPLPEGKNVVGCRWVYKVKYGADGNVERYKARLVAKGFHQQEGLDYVDTFSPVAKMVTVKALLAIAAIESWDLLQLDVNNAFLNGILNEEVYMELPLGYGVERDKRNSGARLVCKLHKSIYGLKQASRQWNAKFTEFMLQSGFTQSKADYTLFSKGSGKTFIALLVYVDDIIITGPSSIQLQAFKNELSKAFRLKDLGPLKFFLGLEIARSRDGISVSQRKYTLQLLEDVGLLAAKPVTTPMDPSVVLNEKEGDDMDDPSQYRRLVGRLLYLTITRPDITFVVHCLSQFMANPKDTHMKAARHLLCYLKQHLGQGVFFSAKSNYRLQAYSDSDWARCVDSR